MNLNFPMLRLSYRETSSFDLNLIAVNFWVPRFRQTEIICVVEMESLFGPDLCTHKKLQFRTVQLQNSTEISV